MISIISWKHLFMVCGDYRKMVQDQVRPVNWFVYDDWYEMLPANSTNYLEIVLRVIFLSYLVLKSNDKMHSAYATCSLTTWKTQEEEVKW